MSEQERKAKAKSVFWWTYVITIFSVIILSSFLADWLHRQSLAGGFGVPAIVAGVYAGIFVCRKRGLSLEEQQVTQLELQKTEVFDEPHSPAEIRLPPMGKNTLWGLIALCCVGLLMSILFFTDKGSLYVRFFGLFMSCGSLCLFFTLIKNRYEPSLLITKNSPTFSQYSWLQQKIVIHWNQVACCKVIDAKGVWGQDTSRVQFLDAQGKVLTTVWLMSMKSEDKAAFLNSLNERFTPEPNRVLD